MTTNTPRPPVSPPNPPSFARRHPILTGFGVLAGISLFAAYFPVSAIVTGVIVGAHATGADRIALRWSERAFAWMGSRVPHRAAPPLPPPPPPPSTSLGSKRAPQPGVSRRLDRSPRMSQRQNARRRKPVSVARTTPQPEPPARAGREIGL